MIILYIIALVMHFVHVMHKDKHAIIAQLVAPSGIAVCLGLFEQSDISRTLLQYVWLYYMHIWSKYTHACLRKFTCMHLQECIAFRVYT